MGLQRSSPLDTGKSELQPHLHTFHSVFPFFLPTRAVGDSYEQNAAPSTDANGTNDIQWSSRASRKRLYLPKDITAHGHQRHRHKAAEEAKLSSVAARLRVHHRTRHNGAHLRADVSFWVAVIFVFGSIAWVINGFLLFLPLISTAKDQAVNAAAWAFIGGTAFNLGSYLMVVEALNTGHESLFGQSVENLLHQSSDDHNAVPPKSAQFYWWGKRSWRDLGYLASAVQLFAATVFWISTLTGLPGVIPGFPESSSVAITDVFFWTPQIIGGCGFIISSGILMLEEQKAWWLPNLPSIGWHVAVWNMVGAVGFTLCGGFGYAANSKTWVNYQSVLSTFWGSWAFLIGSLLQLAETIFREG